MSGLAVACCRVRSTKCCSAHMGPFEEGHHYLPYLHHTLVSGKEHNPTHQQKIGLKFAEHGPTHQNKTQFSPQTVSPIRKLS